MQDGSDLRGVGALEGIICVSRGAMLGLTFLSFVLAVAHERFHGLS